MAPFAQKGPVLRTMPLSVFAPASVGNVSVGFDSLGLALSPIDGTLLGDVVRITPGPVEDWTLKATGEFAAGLPADQEDNIVITCCRRYQQAAAERDVEVRPLELLLDKRLPIGSGLGSSASSIVATLEVLNRYHGTPLSTHEIYCMMTEMEGSISGEIHPDNIAPCLYGGLRLCPPGGLAEFSLPWPGAWRVVACWPGTELVTRKARSVLPEEFPRKTVVTHGAQFAQFVHALYTGNTGLAASSMVDHIAEPYRSSLLPGFEEAKKALRQLGALAVGISGSGPTVFAIVDDYELAQASKDWLAANYKKNETGFVHICRADLGGARSID